MDAFPAELYQEILSHVGLFRERASFRQDHAVIRERSRAVLWVGAICRRWRAVLLQSPEPWSVLILDGSLSDSVYLRACIERSRDHALDVWVTESPPSDHEAQNTYQVSQSLCLIFEHIHRWRRVRIDFAAGQRVSMSAFLPLSTPMPLLEELILVPGELYHSVVGSTILGEDNPQEYGFLAGCPRMRSFVSHAAAIVPSVQLCALQSLSFSIRGVDNENVLWDALAMTPCLQDLNIYFPSRWTYGLPTPPLEPVNLRALSKLGIYGKPKLREWDRYLSVSSTLRTLSVSIEPLNHLLRLLQAFQCQVSHLIITTVEGGHSSGFFSADDAAALDGLEDVQTLELLDIPPRMIRGEPEAFFRALTGRRSHGADAEQLTVGIPRWARR